MWNVMTEQFISQKVIRQSKARVCDSECTVRIDMFNSNCSYYALDRKENKIMGRINSSRKCKVYNSIVRLYVMLWTETWTVIKENETKYQCFESKIFIYRTKTNRELEEHQETTVQLNCLRRTLARSAMW